jgi:hypothetical protein
MTAATWFACVVVLAVGVIVTAVALSSLLSVAGVLAR